MTTNSGKQKKKNLKKLEVKYLGIILKGTLNWNSQHRRKGKNVNMDMPQYDMQHLKSYLKSQGECIQ